MTRNANTSWEGFSIKKKLDVPEGLWQRCPDCENTVFARSVQQNMQVCPECDYHFRIGAQKRIQQLCDQSTFEEMLIDCQPVDALSFTDRKTYAERLQAMKEGA